MKVEIPFKRRFKQVLLDGTKIWTSRTKRYGKRGDTFEIFGAEFLIECVEPRSLGNIAEHWKEEGCESKGDFIEVWRKIHRCRGYVPTQRVYVHIFKRRGV